MRLNIQHKSILLEVSRILNVILLVSQFHGQNISDVTLTTDCIIEHELVYCSINCAKSANCSAFYMDSSKLMVGDPVTNSTGAGTSTS